MNSMSRIPSTLPAICRVRFVLEMTAPTQLHVYHGPTLFALLSYSYGASAGLERLPPDYEWLDAPEQCRLRLNTGDRIAFGLTIIRPTAEAASQHVESLRLGLNIVGQRPAPPKTALGGNFRLTRIEDLIQSKEMTTGEHLAAIPIAHLERETQQLLKEKTITLRFTSPLRTIRPASAREEGHDYFDRKSFHIDALLRRIDKRLQSLGIETGYAVDTELQSAATVVDNHLVWLDVSYGKWSRRKSLGGAVGDVRIQVCDQSTIPMLVMGQYTRIGESTRFGFGRYRIMELGPDPYPCHRERNLLESAFDRGTRKVAHHDSNADEFRQAFKQILCGDYTPDPHSRIQIRKANGDWRELSVPSARDRAIQRRLMEMLQPAMDSLFESSSFAYRRGLGRFQAAKALRSAFRRGFRHAIKADFQRFFDRIDHDELERRVNAYMNDPPTVSLLMNWVRSGAPDSHQGIPTGAPVSPMLANLFLDEFDEQIAATGGYLVRYADDFMILFRSAEQAEAYLATTREYARLLKLQLNDNKSKLVDLTEPFDFLGYRFHCTDRWHANPRFKAKSIEDLGWHDAAPTKSDEDWRLPGEDAPADDSGGPLVIFGPTRGTLRYQSGRFVCDYRDGQPSTRISVDMVREILLLGPITVTHRAIRACADHHIHVLVANAAGHVFATIADSELADDPEVLTGQISFRMDERRRISFAGKLLRAKIANYSALVRVLQRIGKNRNESLAGTLIKLAEQLNQAESISQILGIEGAAAAQWYRSFPNWLPPKFTFKKRVAPNATDPVNILLNIAHTALYRQAAMSAALVEMSPTLGILHEPRQGFLALASDLMEPFRHVMERAVIQAIQEMKPGQFRVGEHGPYATIIEPGAARRFNAKIYEALEQPVIAKGQTTAKSYRLQLIAQARSLRRHLLDPEQPFTPFEHYPP